MQKILVLSIIFGLLVLCSCANKKIVPPPEEKYFQHTISNSGETLGLIATWYTGKSLNWQAIQAANPSLNPTRLKLGQTVMIPEDLMIRREALNAEYVAKNTNKNLPKLPTDLATNTESNKNESEQFQSPEAMAMLGQPKKQTPEQALVNAVMFADTEQVKKLLAAGGNPNLQENNRPLLAWAAQSGSVDIVRALIASGADINAVDGVGHTALMRAVDTMQTETAQALLVAKPNLEIKAPNEKTALHLAVDNSNLDLVRLLVAAGADVNTSTVDGGPVILAATQNGSKEVITSLAAAKANLDGANLIYTPLIYAIEQGNLELVYLLLSLGASPNAKAQMGGTPLSQAMSAPEIFKALLTAKADPNVKDEYGQTILVSAIQNNMQLDVIAALVQTGADLNATDNNGTRVLEYAERQNNPELLTLLTSAGAK